MLRALSLFRVARVAKTAEPAVKTVAVVEKQSFAKTAALSVGGGIVKTTAVVGGLGLVGAGAQSFKNSLFSDLGNITNGSLGSLGSGLGNISNGLGDALGGATDSIMTGVLIVGGVVVVGVLYKVLKK